MTALLGDELLLNRRIELMFDRAPPGAWCASSHMHARAHATRCTYARTHMHAVARVRRNVQARERACARSAHAGMYKHTRAILRNVHGRTRNRNVTVCVRA